MEDLPWMPPHSEVVKRDGGYISVIVKSEEDLTTLLENHKRATLTSFNKWSVKVKDDEKARLVWQVEDYCEDTPLCVTKRVIRDCEHGKASRNTPTAEEHSVEHVYTQKKFHVQKGKKVDCPAKLFLRYVKRYDTYSVKGDASRTTKEEAMKRLKEALAQGSPPTSSFIHVRIPLVEAHLNHIINKSDDVRGVDGSRGAQSLEDGEAQSRGAESTEDGTEILVHDEGAESLEDGVGCRAHDEGAVSLKDIMPQQIKSAQLKLREELKMFSDDTYLCNDLETLTRSTEVLINLRKSFVTQCGRENGLVLNNQKEIVMVRTALPANKRRVAKTKKRKWNQGLDPLPASSNTEGAPGLLTDRQVSHASLMGNTSTTQGL